MKISYFTNIPDNKVPPRMVDGELTISNLRQLTDALLSHHISFATFTDGYRCYDNLISTSWLAYDYDNGTTTRQLIKLLGNKPHIIMASKNHMKDKGDGKGVIPRVHIFVPLAHPATLADKDAYKATWRKHIPVVGVDTTSSDMTRYYYKHKEMLAVGGEWNNKIILEAAEIITLPDTTSKPPNRSSYKINEILLKSPASVSGNGGRRTTYITALNIARAGGDYSDLQCYNATKCSPNWRDSDLQTIWNNAQQWILKGN